MKQTPYMIEINIEEYEIYINIYINPFIPVSGKMGKKRVSHYHHGTSEEKKIVPTTQNGPE